MENKKEETTKKSTAKSGLAKRAGLASTVIWVIAFALIFIVPKTSPYIWVSDALLLIGFWPLLLIWRPGWPWLIFGICNIAIGFLLLISIYLDDSNFTPQMVAVKKHIADAHSPFTWMTIGCLSSFYGIARMVSHSAAFFYRLFAKKAAKKESENQ